MARYLLGVAESPNIDELERHKQLAAVVGITRRRDLDRVADTDRGRPVTAVTLRRAGFAG